jgi:hypothetical protein
LLAVVVAAVAAALAARVLAVVAQGVCVFLPLKQ